MIDNFIPYKANLIAFVLGEAVIMFGVRKYQKYQDILENKGKFVMKCMCHLLYN